MAPLLAALEHAPDIPQVVHDVRENDVVERLVEVEIFNGAIDEVNLGMALARLFEHPVGEVDAHASRGSERREQVAVAAPELEHASPR